MEKVSDRARPGLLAVLRDGIVGLAGVLAGLVVGLAAAGVAVFLIKLLLNSPLPPWGWRTNIVIEMVVIAAVCLVYFRWRKTESWVRSLVVLIAAVVVVMAFAGNGPVVLNLLNLTYFLPPCVVGVIGSLGCMRFLRRRDSR